MPKGLKLHLPFSKISRILWKPIIFFLFQWKGVIKVGFLSQSSSKITVTKAWKGEKKKERGVKERRRSKKAIFALTFISRLWWLLLAGRNSWTQKADLAVDYQYSSYFLKDSRGERNAGARENHLTREKVRSGGERAKWGTTAKIQAFDLMRCSHNAKLWLVLPTASRLSYDRISGGSYRCPSQCLPFKFFIEIVWLHLNLYLELWKPG